ncbi:MAG: SCO family protein [Haloferacaceae archaeon]
MDRRDYLATVAGGSIALTAGCAGVVGSYTDTNPDVALGPPDRSADPEDLPYPAWGEQVPSVTLPAVDPATGAVTGAVDTAGVEEPYLSTFFFSNCNTVCPVLVSALREVQVHAVENGYADAVSFLPVTFDPERDTPAALAEYAARMNVVVDADNWTFLRPESVERATATVTDEFGVTFQKTMTDDGEPGWMYAHTGLVLLVNGDGFAERAYRPERGTAGSIRFDEQTVIDDLRRVRTA